MKSLKIAGLCLASMLVMGMALAGTASAAGPLWLLCLEGKEGSAPTKYRTNQCDEAASGNAGKWESVGLAAGKSDTVMILALSLRLTDKEAGPLREKSTVFCPHPTEGWGLVEGPNLLLIKEAEVSSPSTECAIISGPCSKLEKIKGANLPWREELFETQKRIVSKIEPDGNGEPGWAVTCKTALGSKTDTCLSRGPGTLEEVSAETEKEYGRVTEGVLLVLGEFLNKGRAKCSEGGAESGEVAGKFAILLWNGNGLSINPN